MSKFIVLSALLLAGCGASCPQTIAGMCVEDNDYDIDYASLYSTVEITYNVLIKYGEHARDLVETLDDTSIEFVSLKELQEYSNEGSLVLGQTKYSHSLFSESFTIRVAYVDYKLYLYTVAHELLHTFRGSIYGEMDHKAWYEGTSTSYVTEEINAQIDTLRGE